MADLNLLVGQSSTGTVQPLKADGTPNTTAKVANQVWTFSDPGVTMTVNGDGTALFTGVASTPADVTGTVTADVTDADATVQTLSHTFTVNVGSVIPPTDKTASIGVVFTAPA